MWGGRSGKWKRRFIASLLLTSSIIIEFLIIGRFSPFLLLIYPITIACFSIGYGAEKFSKKIIKRSSVVLASLMSSLLICFLYGGSCWLVLPIEVVVAGVTVYLGVKNPVTASAEEFFICMFLWMPKMLYPFSL